MHMPRILFFSLAVLTAQGYLQAADTIDAAIKESNTEKLFESIKETYKSRLHLPPEKRQELQTFCNQETDTIRKAWKNAPSNELLTRHAQLVGCKVLLELWDDEANTSSHNQSDPAC